LCNDKTSVIRLEKVGRLLVGDKSNFEVIAVGYDGELIDNMRMYNENIEADFNSLFFNIFQYTFHDENENLKSFEDIKKGLKNIVFCAHCAGSHVVNFLVLKLNEFLGYLNLSQEQVSELMGQILVITHSPHETVEEIVPSLNICPFSEPFKTVHWDDELSLMNFKTPSKIVPAELLDCYKQGDVPGPHIEKILQKSKIAYAKRNNKFVVVPYYLTDNSKNVYSFTDHNITSLVYASTHKSTNPETYEFASSVRDFVSSTITNAGKCENIGQMIESGLDTLSANLSVQSTYGE
jgi:hypothetical protein